MSRPILSTSVAPWSRARDDAWSRATHPTWRQSIVDVARAFVAPAPSSSRAGGSVRLVLVVWLFVTFALAGPPIFVAMLAMHLLKMDAAAKVSGYMAAIVIYTHAGDPWVYALMRGFETVLGIAAAFLVSWLPKLVRDPAPAPPSPP